LLLSAKRQVEVAGKDRNPRVKIPPIGLRAILQICMAEAE